MNGFSNEIAFYTPQKKFHHINYESMQNDIN